MQPNVREDLKTVEGREPDQQQLPGGEGRGVLGLNLDIERDIKTVSMASGTVIEFGVCLASIGDKILSGR